jgi:hypothetical protein
MVASLIPTSPSHALSVPTSKAKGSPLEKPKPSMQVAARVDTPRAPAPSPWGGPVCDRRGGGHAMLFCASGAT